jgi:hypothetical protein
VIPEIRPSGRIRLPAVHKRPSAAAFPQLLEPSIRSASQLPTTDLNRRWHHYRAYG